MKHLSEKKFPFGSIERERKAESLSECSMKAVQYSFITVVIYYLIMDENYLHTMLGGNATNVDYWVNYPC